MDKTSIVHFTLAGAIGALAAYFNILLVPLIVLTVVMAVDYLTGMFSASRLYGAKLSVKKIENEVS